MTITHHIDDETLLAYAAGDLDEGFSLLVATHLSLCPQCRKTVAMAEDLGGVMIDDLAPADMAMDALADVMNKLDGAPIERVGERAVPQPSERPLFPAPLRAYVGGDLDRVAWRMIGAGVHQARLHDVSGTSSVRLLRIAGGTGVLEHGHQGEEMTLVLSGGFKDGAHSFGPGDVEFADGSVVHRPVADPGAPCICLAVTSAPLKFFNILGKLAQPLIGI